jgi:hypothetical protein
MNFQNFKTKQRGVSFGLISFFWVLNSCGVQENLSKSLAIGKSIAADGYIVFSQSDDYFYRSECNADSNLPPPTVDSCDSKKVVLPKNVVRGLLRAPIDSQTLSLKYLKRHARCSDTQKAINSNKAVQNLRNKILDLSKEIEKIDLNSRLLSSSRESNEKSLANLRITRIHKFNDELARLNHEIEKTNNPDVRVALEKSKAILQDEMAPFLLQESELVTEIAKATVTLNKEAVRRFDIETAEIPPIQEDLAKVKKELKVPDSQRMLVLRKLETELASKNAESVFNFSEDFEALLSAPVIVRSDALSAQQSKDLAKLESLFQRVDDALSAQNTIGFIESTDNSPWGDTPTAVYVSRSPVRDGWRLSVANRYSEEKFGIISCETMGLREFSSKIMSLRDGERLTLLCEPKSLPLAPESDCTRWTY